MTNHHTQSPGRAAEIQAAARVLLIGSCLGLSWLGMQAVHEFGHVLAAWTTGGTVRKVVLHPLTISRTGVEPNPHPLTVVWGGPLAGSTVPLVLWGAARACGFRWAYLLRFFAGFCLVANGVYLGSAWIHPVGDAGRLLQLGVSVWTLVLFGLATVPIGFRLWHGEGRNFGSGGSAVDVRHALGLATLFVATVAGLWARGAG